MNYLTHIYQYFTTKVKLEQVQDTHRDNTYIVESYTSKYYDAYHDHHELYKTYYVED